MYPLELFVASSLLFVSEGHVLRYANFIHELPQNLLVGEAFGQTLRTFLKQEGGETVVHR